MKHFFAILLGWLPLLTLAQRAPLPPPPDAPAQLARTELLLDPANDEVQVQTLPADTAVVVLIRLLGGFKIQASSRRKSQHSLVPYRQALLGQMPHPRAALKNNRPSIRLFESEHHLEQRAFSRTIRPDQPHPFASGNLEGCIVEKVTTAKSFLESGNGQHEKETIG